MAVVKDLAAATRRNWSAWARRAAERGDQARSLRFLDQLPDNHPSLEPLAPADRDGLRRQLRVGASAP